jgi:hypothetical protein
MKTLFYNPLLLALCAFLTFPLSAQEWNRREQPQNPATIHPQVPVKPYDSALDIVQNAQGPESAPCDNPTPIVCGLSLTNQSNNTGSNPAASDCGSNSRAAGVRISSSDCAPRGEQP